MKYFTSEWWASNDSDYQKSVIEKYSAYFKSVRHLLPDQILDLYENYALHDSRVTHISVRPQQAEVYLKLAGFDRSLDNRLSYELCFHGVSRFDQTFPQGRPRDEQELGDLGYWEVESRPSSTEMRMLFETDAEFLVEFSSLSFSTSVGA